MRYIIVGLGKVGSVLAKEFTQMGNEVIGIDRNMDKVERIKSKISTAICLNVTDESCLNLLPQKDIYAIVITISEDIGQCLTAYSVMKHIKGAKIYVRVADEVQEAIMKSLGITNLLFPEKEASRKYAMSMEIPTFKSSYKVDDDHFVAEIYVPEGLIGYEAKSEEFIKKFKLQLIAVKRQATIHNELGITHTDYICLSSEESWVLQAKDILVIYGHYHDLQNV